MPSVNIYIREDDMDLWKAIERKSEWISDRLNKQPYAVQPQKPLQVNPNSHGPMTPDEVKEVRYESGLWD